MAIDVSAWGYEQRSVRYKLTTNPNKCLLGIITGDTIRVDSGGDMFAYIVCTDWEYGVGVFKVPSQARFGSGKGEWQFVKKPQAILDLESEQAETAAKAAEETATTKRKQAEEAKEGAVASFDEPVRKSAVAATRLRPLDKGAS